MWCGVNDNSVAGWVGNGQEPPFHPDVELKIFIAADGGIYHAQADNRQVGVDYIADWISANLP